MAKVTSGPLISVVVTTHNRPTLLERALDSVAAQTEQDVEVLVVDDGSTPERAMSNQELVRGYDERFRYILRPLEGVRHGCGVARNEGVFSARGRYVTFLDDDDFWCDSTHLEVAAGCLRDHPDIDMYVASQKATRGEEVVMPVWMPALKERTRGQERLGKDVFRMRREDLLGSGGIGFAHVNITIARRELVTEVGGFWDAPYEEDLNFFLRFVDRAQAFAHRPVVVSVNTVRDVADDSGLSSIASDSKSLLRILHVEHALLHCSTPEVRRYARRLLSNSFKGLAKSRWIERDHRNAALLARQAVTVDPSVRWHCIAWMARTVSAFRALRGQ